MGGGGGGALHPRGRLRFREGRPSGAAERLRAAGFTLAGRVAHSENWRGPDGTPVQFTDDAELRDAIARAERLERGGVALRVLARADLLHAKLRSGTDPAGRRSRRLQDLGDVQALLEVDPALAHERTPAERAVLDRLP